MKYDKSKDILYRIKTPVTNKQIMSFDIETYSDRNKFLMCGIYDKDSGYRCHRNKDDAIKDLLNPETAEYLRYATNLEFDFNGVFFENPIYTKFELIMNDSRMIQVMYTTPNDANKNNRVIRFLDTLNLAKLSVKEMGKMIGMKKLNDEVEDLIGKKPKTASEWETMKNYNKMDCLITHDFTQKFQDVINSMGGNLKPTASSCSLDIFRRKYMTRNLAHEIVTTGKNYNQLIFQAYYGGRCEALARGYITNRKLYDVSSLYPFIMTHEMPIPETAHFERNPMKQLLEYEGVSQVDMFVDKSLNIPLLPYRWEGKLIFPVGDISGTYTNEEIRLAIASGYKLKKIYWTLYYRKTDYIFKDFVEKMYDSRMLYKEQKNDIMAYFLKLLMNSLSGKMASRWLSSISIIDYENLTPEMIKMIDEGDIQGFGRICYQQKKRECREPYVMPILPVIITAKARNYMYGYMIKYDVEYIDTDGIITRKDMPSGNKLGQMKLEHEIKKGIIVKPKTYIIDAEGIVTAKNKGFNKMNEKDFYKAINGRKVKQTRFIKMRESMIRDMPINMILHTTKKMDVQDNKRVWTKPFTPYMYDRDSRPHFVSRMI